MPLADINTSLLAVSPIEPIHLLLTIAVFVVMVSVFAVCTCCGNEKHNRDKQDEADYGVVTVSGNPTNPTAKPAALHNINFRTNPVKAPHERHSQPVTNMNMLTFNRQSAPGRALPKLPADLYTAIDKKSKRGAVTAGEGDDIRFADETVNPMYECIDAETDSFVDPLYSKVGDVPGTSATRDRKYDYPIFSGRQNKIRVEDTVYQSASQIYAPNSEDPYSSITSERGRNANENDGDNSSAYDPGYAKVNLNTKARNVEDKKKEKIEKTERELDLLYSKIRRNVPTYANSSEPGPSNRPEPVLPTYPIVEPIPHPVPFDEQSAVSSREPSYRYITMRENADVVRERLRQQGQLDQPRREHYYSTIGNEYETIANGHVNQNQNRNPHTAISIDTQHRAPLANISTSSILDAPPPPTSPIPERSRPVSYIDTYGSVLSNSGIPPPPDLRCSPVPPRPPGDDIQPHVFSISHASSSSQPQRIAYPNDGNDAYTMPATNRTAPSFRSLETLLGKRTVEEKETIVEQRSTFATGVPIPIPTTSNANDMMSRSMDSWGTSSSRAVHEVPIRRLDRNYEGPSVDVIISGRRYRSGQGVLEDTQSLAQGTSAANGVRVENDKEAVTSTLEKRQERTKSSSDREDEPEPGKSGRSARSKKTWKDETEEERVQRLGTIYTANDYVCPMDMTDQKPWPMSGHENGGKKK